MNEKTLWYYEHEGNAKGPCSEDEILCLLTTGTIHPDPLVWRQGFQDWIRLSDTELQKNNEAIPLKNIHSQNGSFYDSYLIRNARTIAEIIFVIISILWIGNIIHSKSFRLDYFCIFIASTLIAIGLFNKQIKSLIIIGFMIWGAEQVYTLIELFHHSITPEEISLLIFLKPSLEGDFLKIVDIIKSLKFISFFNVAGFLSIFLYYITKQYKLNIISPIVPAIIPSVFFAMSACVNPLAPITLSTILLALGTFFALFPQKPQAEAPAQAMGQPPSFSIRSETPSETGISLTKKAEESFLCDALVRTSSPTPPEIKPASGISLAKESKNPKKFESSVQAANSATALQPTTSIFPQQETEIELLPSDEVPATQSSILVLPKTEKEQQQPPLQRKKEFRWVTIATLAALGLVLTYTSLKNIRSIPDNEFISFCKKGTADEVRRALKHGANINAKDANGDTALMLAVANSNLATVRALLAAGTDVNVQNRDGATPLIAALLKNPNSEIIKMLLVAGADVNVKDQSGATPLMMAAQKSNPQVVRVLLAAGANVLAQNKNGVTALMLAAAFNANPEVVEALLKAGANIHTKDNEGRTALDWANVSKSSNSKVVQILHEADSRPVKMAEKAPEPERASEPLSQQSPASLSPTPTRLSDSAFLELCKSGTAEEVREALANGANLNAKNRLHTGSLMLAAGDNPDPEVVKTLLRAGAKVNAANKNHWTALMLAAGYNPNSQVVRTLLDAGANIHAKSSVGTTALMAAAQHSPNPEVITMLLRAGADVNAKNNKGQNALWCARHSKREKISTYQSAEVDQKIVVLLLQAGARTYDSPTRDNFNLDGIGTSDTQFIALCRQGTTEEIRNALAAGANPNATKELNWTALMETAMHNPRSGAVTVLLSAGARVNAQDDNGWSALMVAAKHNPNPEVVAALLRAGADVNARNYRGDNALSCAWSPGSLRAKAIKNSVTRRAVNAKIVQLIKSKNR
ncbi:MAG: ankyrin repeat domain-containing protein [bacterium]|nr:ankyrin repeat domain-containing protein [bacterium]